MKKIIIAFLLFACCQQIHAQQSKVDSVIYLLNKSKTAKGVDTTAFYAATNFIRNVDLNDTILAQLEKVGDQFTVGDNESWSYNIKFSIFNNLITSNKEKAIAYGKYQIEKLEKSISPDALNFRSNFLRVLRLPYRNSDRLNEGFQFYNEKLKEYKLKNDSDGLSDCYFVLSGFYRTTGLVEQAIYNMKKSISYLDTTTAIGRSDYFNNGGVLGFYNLLSGDYKQSIQYSTIFFQEYIFQNDSVSVAFSAQNIVLAKLMSNQLDSVSYYMDIAINQSQKFNIFENLVAAMQVKAIYKIKTDSLTEAETILYTCWKLINEHHISANPASGDVGPDYYLAIIRIKQNRNNDAIALLIKDIAWLNNQRLYVLRDYKLMAELYEKTGNNEKAKDTYKKFISLQDSLQADQNKYRSLSFETEQQMSEKENAMLKLKSENKIAAISQNYSMGIAILLLLIAVGIYMRFRSKQKANVELEEKNKIISDEKNLSDELLKKSDDLLLNILPAEVAEELKNTGATVAKQYNDVSVLFTDFVNFTGIGGQLSPTELVAEIHKNFTAFDVIIEKYGLEKIKTIGDAYMAVCGLPHERKDHAQRVVKAAQEIKEYIASSQGKFQIRIGIHSGPVVAGIVGVKKFAYDIWGDTVNTANRMESNCEADKINISGSTYELVKDDFNCEHRGKISVKGKGEVDMYFVD